MVECQLPKLDVGGSNPLARSIDCGSHSGSRVVTGLRSHAGRWHSIGNDNKEPKTVAG